jgi:16S rRNA (cytidine1402-2'-O)-methyltransferase
MKNGELYLIPSLLGDTEPELVLPEGTISTMRKLDYFIVEHLRTSRRLLSKIKVDKPIEDIQFFELNKHTSDDELHAFLKPALSGHNMGLMSEAGTPCIADPGAVVVEMAHAAGIRVIPLSGPSSITMALMASGLNGQSFAFHGYLPIHPAARDKTIKTIENVAALTNQTQIFIETPFRNNQLFAALLRNCSPKVNLCIATNISLPNEQIQTLTIDEWNNNKPDLHKKPSVFLIGYNKTL